jgi:Bacterial Ig domain
LPANGAIYTSPAKITLNASATDPDGSVTRVEFFNGGTTKLGEDTSPPYSLRWNVGAAGTYTLTARATDNAGATTNSNQVTVTVRKKN